MKNYKKLLSVGVVLVMIVCMFTACGEQKSNTPDQTTAPTTSNGPYAPTESVTPSLPENFTFPETSAPNGFGDENLDFGDLL